MRIIKPSLLRQPVIEAYARYDCRKKMKPLPDFTAWKWHSVDDVDRSLAACGLKTGVLAGYKEWNYVALDLTDLRQCAVVSSISGNGPRELGQLEAGRFLVDWRPDRAVLWLESVRRGTAFAESEPFILRPATLNERPARWYLEDGSGRATAIVANASLFTQLDVIAYAYLGVRSDPASSFIQRTRFPSL